MANVFTQAETAQVAVDAQPVKGKGVNGHEKAVTSVTISEDLLASMIDSIPSEKEAVKEESGGTTPEVKTKDIKSQPPKKKDWKPTYDGEELKRLLTLTEACKTEIARVIADPLYHAVRISDNNCVIPLHKVKRDGKIQFVTPKMNRTHGSDQQKTGESILTFGAQHFLIVITGRIARTAGIEATHFPKTKNKRPIQDTDLLFIDGNGRMGFLEELEPAEYPEIYGIFPSPDAAGLYNISKAFDIINTQVSVWKTQDMVQKRMLAEGAASHPAWGLINELSRKGYMYQAACVLITLKSDRIKKEAVVNGKAEDIFTNYSDAVKIYEKLKSVFGEGEDKVLKTKAFPMEVVNLWQKLVKKFGNDKATAEFLKFLSGISEEKIKEIKNARSKKGEASKDEKRKELLQQEFYKYVGKQNLNIE